MSELLDRIRAATAAFGPDHCVSINVHVEPAELRAVAGEAGIASDVIEPDAVYRFRLIRAEVATGRVSVTLLAREEGP